MPTTQTYPDLRPELKALLAGTKPTLTARDARKALDRVIARKGMPRG